MKDSIHVGWEGGMSFSTSIHGHKLVVDAKEEFGGNDKGPRPKALMMLALAGCTGMDVISILKKMRIDPEGFNVHIDSELTDEHPKQYTKMHLIYEFKGKNLDTEKLKKAIELSQDKYCGVSASLKKAMEITYEIKIIE
ncbi:MAG: OsmC family protein [Bacteroidales bacterium]|nr:OsmC family protein [Bacteroidales bacterium]